MKIAHIVSTFPPYKGGTGNSVNCFSRALSNLGVDVTVITPDYGATSVKSSLKNNKESIADGSFAVLRLLPAFKYGNAAFLPQILFKLSDFDVIHLHYPFYGVACLVLINKILSGKKMKLVLHYHMDTLASGFKGLIFSLNRALVLPLLVTYSDKIICSSADYARNSDIAPFYRKFNDKFSIIPYGVDLDKFKMGDDKREEIRNRHILFVGGLDKAHYFKGLEMLLNAFAIISNDDYYLSIVGSGDMRRYYEDLAKSLRISDRVSFYDRVNDDELANYYQKSDVLVLPSINTGEAFGLVLLEAMASCRPVIASDLPGVRSVFTDGKEGYLVKPGNSDDLAEKITRILGDDNLAKRMGQAGRKTAEEKYSWNKSAADLLEIYKGL